MKYLSEEEINKIIKSVRPPYSLLFEFLYKTGVRISEARELTPQSIDFKHSTVKVRSLKRKKEVYRYIPLEQGLLEKLQEYIKTVPSKQRLFSHTSTWYWMILQKVAEVTGIDKKRMHPHAFRHSFGVRATLKKVPLAVIKGWMGHADISSTQVYTDVTVADTVDLYRQVWE